MTKPRKTFFALKSPEIILILVVYSCLAIYATGILQTTILTKDPQTHIVQPFSGDKPEHIVILLHSASSEARFIVPITGYMALFFPDALFIVPDAPNPSRVYPYSFSWFHRGMKTTETALPRLETTAPFLLSLIKGAMSDYDLPAERIILVGYSQGAVMALNVAHRLEGPVGAVVSLSGYIAGTDNDYRNLYKHSFPVCIIHGGQDDKIPKSEYFRMARLLEELNSPLYKELIDEGDHDISKEAVDHAIKCLQNVL